MSYYCHECAQRRDLLYNPLSCAVCGSEMIDSVRYIYDLKCKNALSIYSVRIDTDH
ncbi:hypothetical protein BD408DRAFT_139929 [Parasitella parasitica]|nr:hypothetical protein BD408DRAFT_139929 [Parasitella parasitica]